MKKTFSILGKEVFSINREERTATNNMTGAQVLEIFGGTPTASGANVTEETALSVSAVYSAVRVLAEAVASIPLQLYVRTEEGRNILNTDPLYHLLHDEPNQFMDSFIWRELQMTYLCLWGNAYNYIERDPVGRITSLLPISPNNCDPVYDSKRNKIFYVINTGDKRETIEQTNILHFKGLSFDGIKGKSPVQMARESYGLSIATQKFGAKFFGNGTNMGGIITHPGKLTDQSLNNLKASWGKHTGLESSHGTPILEEGMKYEKMGIPPEDAQFLETRKFQITEVARWFKVPPHMIADLERSTFSNIEQQDINFVKYSVLPWAKRIESEIKRKLIPEMDKHTVFAEFNLEGLLRGDIKTRADYYSKMRTIGVMSANEIREKENMNRREDAGGDSYENPNTTAGGKATPTEEPDGEDSRKNNG